MSSELLPFEEFFEDNEEEDYDVDADEEIFVDPDDDEFYFFGDDEQHLPPFENISTLQPYAESDYDSLSELYFYFKVLNFSEIWLKRKNLYRNFLFKQSLDSNLKLNEVCEMVNSQKFNDDQKNFNDLQSISGVDKLKPDYYSVNYFGSHSSRYVMTSNSFNHVMRSKVISNPFLLKNNKFLRFYFNTISDVYTRELFFFFDYHSNAFGSVFSNPLVF